MNEAVPLQPELLLAHVAWVRRLAGRLVFEAAMAEDVAQQTLLEALASPPRDQRNPRGWLASVARRVASRTRRRERGRRSRELAAARSEEIPSTDEVVARALLQRAVVDAVVALAEPYRTTVLLRYFDELPPRTIAERLSVPVETVRTRLKRGLTSLRETLARDLNVETQARGRRTGLGALMLLLEPSRSSSAIASSVATSGATAAAASLFGALVMTTKIKLAIAASVVMAGSLALWSTLPKPPTPTAASSATAPIFAPQPATIGAGDGMASALEIPSASRSADSSASPLDSRARAGVVARTVAGCVRTADGRPVADALVAIEPSGRGRLGDLASFVSGSRYLLHDPIVRKFEPGCTLTDAEGHYELRAPDAKTDANEVQLGAIHEQEGFALRRFVALATDAPSTQVDFVLDPGVIVEGRVADEEGEGIPRAGLMLFGFIERGKERRQESVDDIIADADGRYRSLPLPARELQIGASADGFVGNLGVHVTVPLDERVHSLHFKLKRAQYLAGRLVDLDGETVAPRSLACEVLVGGCRRDPASLQDPRGEVVFGAAVAEDGTWKLQLTGNELNWVAAFAGRRLLDAAEIVAGDRGPDLVVDPDAMDAMVPKGSLELRVRDGRDGSPVASFEVEIQPQTSSLPEASAHAFHRTASVEKGALQIDGVRAAIDPHWKDGLQAGGNGIVRLDAMVAGKWWARVQADGFSPVLREFVLSPGAGPTTVDVSLLPPTACIRGRVVDERARPVAGAELRLDARNGAPTLAAERMDYTRDVASDADGRFVLDRLPAGDFFVVAQPRNLLESSSDVELGAASAPVHLESGDVEVALTLRPAVRVRVELHSAARSLPGPYSFRLRDERGARLRDDTRPGHECAGFATGNVFKFATSPGRYTLEVLSQSTRPATLDFSAAPDKLLKIEILPVER